MIMLGIHYFYQWGANKRSRRVSVTVNDKPGGIYAELQADLHRSSGFQDLTRALIIVYGFSHSIDRIPE